MDIKTRIKEKLNEMNMNDLSHEERKFIDGIIKQDKIKPQFILKFRSQDYPLKAKSKDKAKEEAVKIAQEKGFNIRNANLVKSYAIKMMGGISHYDENISTLFL